MEKVLNMSLHQCVRNQMINQQSTQSETKR